MPVLTLCNKPTRLIKKAILKIGTIYTKALNGLRVWSVAMNSFITFIVKMMGSDFFETFAMPEYHSSTLD